MNRKTKKHSGSEIKREEAPGGSVPGQVSASSSESSRSDSGSEKSTESTRSGEPISRPSVRRRQEKRRMEAAKKAAEKQLSPPVTGSASQLRFASIGAPLNAELPTQIHHQPVEPLSWQERHKKNLERILTGANVVTSVLVANSDIVHRSVIMTGGGIAQWMLRLNTILDRARSNSISKEDAIFLGMGYMLTLTPAMVYPFWTDDANSLSEKIFFSSSILLPAVAEFLIEKFVLPEKPKEPRESKMTYESSWKEFFLTRREVLQKIGGISDIAFNNILASLWMSNEQVTGRLFATAPTLIFTSLATWAALQSNEKEIEKAFSTNRSTIFPLSGATSFFSKIASALTITYAVAILYSYVIGSPAVFALEDWITLIAQLGVGVTSFGLSQRLNWELVKLAHQPPTQPEVKPEATQVLSLLSDAVHADSLSPTPLRDSLTLLPSNTAKISADSVVP